MSSEKTTVKSVTAYGMIRDLIISGDLLPGTRLVLSELEQKLGVGRGPIREALLRLDKSGLVQNYPYKGVVVMPPPTFKEMEVLYQLRATIEVCMASESLRKATPEDIADLEQILEDMKRRKVDEAYYFHEDCAFHSALYRIAGMHHLQIIVERIMDHIEVFLNLHSYEPTDTQVFLQQHAEIINALKEHDEVALCATLRKNILMGVTLVEKELLRFQYRKR